jgi:hypothetical protein
VPPTPISKLTNNKLDYKISFLFTLHLEPIAVVRDPKRQGRSGPWPTDDEKPAMKVLVEDDLRNVLANVRPG